MTLRVALIGMGRMGRAIEEVAGEHDVRVVARLGRSEMEDGGTGAGGDFDLVGELAGADVAIDFSTPDAAVPNALRCLAAGVPLVIGTTGWQARLAEVEAAVAEHDGALLWAANFSAGVAVTRALARSLGVRAAGLDGYDVHLVETHHAAKKDAPSGTALALRKDVSEGLGREVGVTSIRVGKVPGTHEIVVDGPFEQIVLRHEARDRRVFADGAVRAARWLHGRTGLFTFDDLFADDR